MGYRQLIGVNMRCDETVIALSRQQSKDLSASVTPDKPLRCGDKSQFIFCVHLVYLRNNLKTFESSFCVQCPKKGRYKDLQMDGPLHNRNPCQFGTFSQMALSLDGIAANSFSSTRAVTKLRDPIWVALFANKAKILCVRHRR
ncbi:hypothetical protein CEXT_249791 [Caerostris extrusa]|uniref:Uncharacterized protein n=1 Tax=Caerostris extrusa TaxID=172846 RepID=A0AAV4S1J5_CAEEX|nr:hypothetical protein CEXT_249791 [Caerostris extrusa]